MADEHKAAAEAVFDARGADFESIDAALEWRDQAEDEKEIWYADAWVERVVLADDLVGLRALLEEVRELRKRAEAAPAVEPAEVRPVDSMSEAMAEWLHECGGFLDAMPDYTWPEHPQDEGRREGGWVKILPSDVLAQFRDVGRRLVASSPLSRALQHATAERDAATARAEKAEAALRYSDAAVSTLLAECDQERQQLAYMTDKFDREFARSESLAADLSKAEASLAAALKRAEEMAAALRVIADAQPFVAYQTDSTMRTTAVEGYGHYSTVRVAKAALASQER